MNRPRALLFVLVAALVVGLAGTAGAQYPITGVDDCAETFGGGGDETTTFAPGDDIQVQGRVGCAQPDEQDIEALLFSDPVLLDRFDANADGSYVSEVVSIPADTEPGDHNVVVRTQDNEYVQPITVTGAGVPSGLPQTGRNVAMLALWGTLTLVLGSALIGLTWRRWREARVTAELDTSWAARPKAVGTLFERGTAPYRPEAIDWVDPLGAADLDAAELPVAVEPEEPETPEPARPPAASASNGGRRLSEETREIATRASTRTTEIVDRLQDELAAWRR